MFRAEAPKIDRPLVTIAIPTYNQEKYVRDAIRGALSQTYEPLQIVISDDCSQDGTWKIITQEVELYVREGGRHHNILLNRNEENLGIMRHCQKIVQMCNGRLLLFNAGDDISVSKRVELVVKAWFENGARATVVCHAWEKMDINGGIIGNEGPWPITMPLGAAVCYDVNALRKFAETKVVGAFEDHVFVFRSLCFGNALMMLESLVRYRIGTGVTSGSNFVKNRMSVAKGSLLAAEQSKLDFAEVRGKLAFDKIVELERFLEFEQSHYGAEYKLLTGKTLALRWDGFKRMNGVNGWNLSFVMRYCYYFPCVISFNFARSIHYLLLKRRQLKDRLQK